MVMGHVGGCISHRAVGKDFTNKCCSRNLIRARGCKRGVRDRVLSGEATAKPNSLTMGACSSVPQIAG